MRSANGLKVENQTALDNAHLTILFTAVHYIYITSAAIAMSIQCKVSQAGTNDQCNSAESETTNWQLCFLCQIDDNGHLQCPINAKGTKSGYQYIASNLLEFKGLGCVPMNVNLDRLDEGYGIAETLSSHSAVYHKSCYLRFTSSKLERAQKKRASGMSATSISKKTRSMLNTSNPCQQEPICFFCNKSSGQLHKASTKEIDAHVRECAIKLNDDSLLAKLAMSDMHALDAQYHRKCLVALYNRMRQHSSDNDCKSNHGKSTTVQAETLAELALYIEEAAQNEDMASVFKLSDLTKLYTERLNRLGHNTGSRVNSTRLKERLLAVLPELKAYANGREVLLAYEKDRPRPIMLKILPIMLLSSAQKNSPLCSILCS